MPALRTQIMVSRGKQAEAVPGQAGTLVCLMSLCGFFLLCHPGIAGHAQEQPQKGDLHTRPAHL